MIPKVSIIIPNYNYSDYLKERIDSILKQTYKKFEIIFLDDASSDKSLDILENYKDSIKKIVINDKNSGSPFLQWEKGIDLSEGEYIWIAEADDFSDELFLEKLIDKLEKEKSLGMAYCQTVPVDEKSIIINSFNYIQYTDFLDKKHWLSEYFNYGKIEVENYLSIICTIINVSSVVFRKNIIKKNIVTNLKQSGDWLTYIKILKENNISYIPDKLNYHRIHKKKQTANTVTDLTYFKEMIFIYRYLIKNFNLSKLIKKRQFNHILNQWLDHYDGPYGKISKTNNLYLLFLFLVNYPLGAFKIILYYLVTIIPKKIWKKIKIN